MMLATISAVILFILAIDNVYEFLTVYKVRTKNDKASMVEIHSRVVEAAELIGYLVAGFMIYVSELNLAAVVIVIVIGLFHSGGVIMTKQSLQKMSTDALKRLNTGIIGLTLTEVIVAISVILWMTSNGWIGL